MREKVAAITKKFIVKRQVILFITIILSGASLVMAGVKLDDRLVMEGIAFLMIGFVGLVMAWTTFDVSSGIKEVIREVGEQNQQVIREVGEQNQQVIREVGEQNQQVIREVGEQNQQVIREVGDKIQSSIDTMTLAISKNNDVIAENMKISREAIENTRETIENTREAANNTRDIIKILQKQQQ